MLDRIEATLSHRQAFVMLVTLAALLAFGHELFTFRLNIDDELELGFYKNTTALNISQARWGLALLQWLVLPQPITSTVSAALGLIGLGCGLYLGLSRILPPLALLCAVLIGITTPALVFLLGFKGLGFSCGIAWLCVGVFPQLALSASRRSMAVAILLGALALGVYQTMLLALAFLTVAWLYGRLLAGEGWPAIGRDALRLASSIAASCALYLVVDFAARHITGNTLYYVQSRVDLAGLAAHPLQRLDASYTQVREILSTSPRLYGSSAPATTITLSLAVDIAVFRAFSMATTWRKLAGIALVLAPTGALVLADAVPPGHSDMWSWGPCLPFALAPFVGFAASTRFRWVRLVIVAGTMLSVIADAATINRLSVSGTLAFQRDVAMTAQIEQAIRAGMGSDNAGKPLQLVVSGTPDFPETALILHRESYGASFYRWDEGNRHRIAALISLLTTLPMIGADADTYRVHANAALAMPDWPAPGSVKVEDGVAIVKFGKYTRPQKQELCGDITDERCPY
jgi:hypothetical protein